jgi:hypothetical protein
MKCLKENYAPRANDTETGHSSGELHMGIQGSNLKSTNNQLRFYLIIFGGLIAFGSVFYWRQQTLKQAEYVDLPQPHTRRAQGELRSENFQLEVQDSSPTAQ